MKNLASRIAATAVALALLLSFNASAANESKKETEEETVVSQKSCLKITNQELSKRIRERLSANSEIESSMNHLNVSVKKRVVKLEGWLDDTLIPKAVATVKETQCVTRVINKLKESGGGSCGAGQKQCGDTCIDKDSTCTISTKVS